MLPLRDNIPTRRFPVVTVALIAINAAVWIFVQGAGSEPSLTQSVNDFAWRPCEPQGGCEAVGHLWIVDAFTSMFLHAGWAHLLGNMLFLWIFGNNVEDAMGRFRFPLFYVLGGLFATAVQSIVTLETAGAQAAEIPNLGASGAVAAVLGAYIILFPGGRVLTWIFPIFILPLPAMLYLGIWFALQLLSGLDSFNAPPEGGGVAFFAHIGGFVFGLLAVRVAVPGWRMRRW